MEICCLEDCGENSVRPILVASGRDDGPIAFYPCLPPCTKAYYCSEKPKSKQCCQEDNYRQSGSRRSEPMLERRGCSSSNQERRQCRPPSPCPSCCEKPCKPVKTKYIIPCYRYEDGRIANQPTALMRRACEVAVGKRPRKKPYEETRFIKDAEHQETRYIREDEETTRRPKPAAQSNGKTKIARIRNKTAIKLR